MEGTGAAVAAVGRSESAASGGGAAVDARSAVEAASAVEAPPHPGPPLQGGRETGGAAPSHPGPPLRGGRETGGAASPVVGYLVGCLEDPARTPRFADIGYFRELAPLTARFPAHLHINLTAACRSHGIGARLIAAFCAHAATRGARGVHVVTGRHQRNVRFYVRMGFLWRGSVGAGTPRELVLLGRELV